MSSMNHGCFYRLHSTSGTIFVQKPYSYQCFILGDFLLSEPFLFEDPPSHFFLPENPEEPEFADWAETNVTAQLGGSVFLHCPVINSGDRAVSYPSVSIFLLITNTFSFLFVK